MVLLVRFPPPVASQSQAGTLSTKSYTLTRNQNHITYHLKMLLRKIDQVKEDQLKMCTVAPQDRSQGIAFQEESKEASGQKEK